MQAKQNPLILTLKMDEESQAFFDRMRRLYFPPERNFRKAHCMLFHQLPDTPETLQVIHEQELPVMNLQITGLMNLGAGVAYRVEAPELAVLHSRLSKIFKAHLIPQDRQGFRPHITVQNKVTPATSLQLLQKLSIDFIPFSFTGTGLQLWRYMYGPWELLTETRFSAHDLFQSDN